MGIVFVFLLGIGNFAAQRAVLQSGHPMLAILSRRAMGVGRMVSLSLEFVLLVLAMTAASNGLTGWLWLYLAYSVFNVAAAWLIANRRI